MIRPVALGPFLKGLDASTDPYTVPKGAVRRVSNLIFTQRGGLTDCDGTSIVNWYTGAIQTNRGRFMAVSLFAPTGVNPYYMALASAPDQHLGTPVAISATPSAGGSLTSGQQYFYKITALDGAGGETLASNEVSGTPSGGNLSNTLVWNTIPSAYGYNVYRGTSSGSESKLIGTTVPVLQPSPLTGTATFIDNGSLMTGGATIAVSSANSYKIGGIRYTDFTLLSSAPSILATSLVAVGFTPSSFNGPFNITAFESSLFVHCIGGPGSGSASVPGVVTFGVSPPLSDTTAQTVLFLMPSSVTLPIPYSSSNIVAYFPASPPTLGGSPSSVGQGNSTPSGGIVGMVSLIPQMVQFTNRIAIALGNGFSPQLYWDSSGSKVNPAPTGAIASVSLTGDQVTVTVAGSVTISGTDPIQKGFMPVGSNVILSGMSDPTYNGVFPVLAISPGAGGTFTIRNPSASGGPAIGIFIVSTTPLINTFIPAYPAWAANSAYALNSIVQPAAIPETYYFKAVQAGVSNATTEPIWTNAATLGQQIADGTIIWENQGSIQSSAPPPPGAAHLIVYSSSLWAWDTYPTNSSSGLDGPTSLRMSDVNNPFSWNPINQAFIDKDDGTEGMGLATFTISAEGIPPEGSLVAFKNYAGYQIVGVFGSSNFAIQRIRSDMGCTSPRTIKFVPGFGIVRNTHLGFANFDGVRDQLISEPVRPFLFMTNDSVDSDITIVDSSWMPVASADLTTNPPMYALAAPIGNSGGALTRLFTYDLVLKAWSIIDLPFSISVIYQARLTTATPITLFGGFLDGILQRWQAGDSEWDDPDPDTLVAWSVTLPDVFAPTPDQKMQCRRAVIRGISSGAASLSVTFVINGVAQPAQTFPLPASGDFEVFAGLLMDTLRIAVILSGSGHIEIDRVVLHLSPKAVGVPMVIS